MNKKLFLLTMSLLAVTMLQAQNIIHPKVECPNGIYVNSYNGVLFYQRPDVSVANRNMRLEAVFYYNSSSNKKNYGYGNGWSLGSELRFVNDSLGVIIEQGDGRQDLYTRYGNSFEAPAGVFSTLSIEGDGYLLTYKDGTKYYFTDTVSKKVTQVKDRYDNAITYTYQEGNLATASDISGRSLYFAWSNDLLSGIRTSFDDRTWSYGYDENGNLTSVTDPMGYTVHYAYNKDNRIKTFTDAEGYSTHISYNADGMAHRVKTDLTDKSIRYEVAKRQTIFVDYIPDAHNQYNKYVWDEQGRLVEIENVNTGARTKFAYDDDNNLVYREDANGNAHTYTYDENGNQLSSTDPLGNTEYYTYESTFNKVTSYTDKMGNYFNYQYDEHGDLLQMNGPLNYSLSITYNEYGQAQTITDAGSNTYSFSYDNYGNMVSLTDPLGNTTTRSYTEAGLMSTMTMPNGGVRHTYYDKNQRIISAVDVLNHAMTMEYDKCGNIVNLIGYRSYAVSYIYNALQQVLQITDQQGGQKKYTYDAMGNPTVTIDELGHTNRLYYNDDNLLAYTVGPLNDTMWFSYDGVGNIVGVKTPNGRIITSQFDPLNRMVMRSDQMGLIESCSYDANGNILSYTDADGYTSNYEYDALGRIITITDALGKSEYFSYDVMGNMLTRQDKNGNATIYSYDALNRKQTETDAMGFVTTYEYDAMGNVTSIIGADGQTTSYEYDLKGNLTKTTYSNGKTEQYWYDEEDNMIIKEDDLGRITHYAYNNVNQLIRVDYPDSSSDVYTYDLSGNLLTATNANAVVEYSYDALGRTLSESINGIVTSYNYDDDNQFVTMHYPNGKTIKQELDIRSRVQCVRNMDNLSAIATFAYNGMDKVIQQAYANGITTDFVYDACGNLIEQYDNTNTVHFEISYDANGNLIAKKDYINNSNSETYTYNSNDQLIDFVTGPMDENNSIPSPNNTWHYELNPYGQIVSESINGVLSQYFSNDGAIVSVQNGIEVISHYDTHGLLTNDSNHTYQYDACDRLIGVDLGNTASYLYDALGRRIERSYVSNTGIETEQYIYSGTKLIACNDASGSAVYSNYYGFNGILLEKDSGDQHFFYHTDQNLSTSLITNIQGDAIEYYSYSPKGQITCYNAFGNQLSLESSQNSVGFKSYVFDSETGFLNGMVHQTNQLFTINPTIGFATDYSKHQVNSTMWDLFTDVYSAVNDYLGDKKNSSIINSLYQSAFSPTNNTLGWASKRWAHNDLNRRLANGTSITDTFDDYKLQKGKWKRISAGVDDFIDKYDKAMKIIHGAQMLVNMPEMIDDVRNSDSYKDRLHHIGTWGEQLYLDFCPPLAVVDWIYKKIYKAATGEETDGLVVKAFEGYGMIADLAADALDKSCADFQRTGYDNATPFQQGMANLVNHPLSTIMKSPINPLAPAWTIGEKIYNWGNNLIKNRLSTN